MPEPYRVVYPADRCEGCTLRPEEGRLHRICGRCRSVVYCSKECQAKQWKYHNSLTSPDTFRAACRYAQKRYARTESGKPTAEATNTRALREFFSIHTDNFVYCVELAIIEDMLRSVPAGLSGRDLVQAYNASDHIAYFELSPRANDGNPSTTFGIKRSVYTTVDAFKKSPDFNSSTRELLTSTPKEVMDKNRHYELHGTEPGYDIGLITMLLHIPGRNANDMGYHYGHAKLVYIEQLSHNMEKLISNGIGLSALASWKTMLSFFVDVGISSRFFLAVEDEKRHHCYGEMVKVEGEPGSKTKWTWVQIPWDEYDARIEELMPREQSQPAITTPE
ncbi:uncharacterized protein STEHIDRAFT_113365 [Stereum hirsutum FP-91666 SS1]|uniref:uncharacterized protein n=1 Tax=Stereum hirsutum (strain FP-91666) TaxID=721885 RepID=UPI000444A0CA|nr:uncharacterized protein STEHIDRAFT_113365 [Stereum hirsutum FP-91666 SS1]EIM83181.1 hypothetical protein STEHIDRAFT_113365 [Stereum hirsutum FP-91666 SS1]